MARLLSVALTEDAVRNRLKNQTRRLGWTFLRPGDRLRLVRKSMGRSHLSPDGTRWTEPIVSLGLVQVTAVRREPLDHITDFDVFREGFGPWHNLDWWHGIELPLQDDGTRSRPAAEFVSFFTRSMRCPADAEVTVIDWTYLDGEELPL